MLLERLSIENYGVYAGKSEFDLASTKEKPIVLVGGLNGAGKTTIFESLMVGLYGKTYLGRRATNKEYTEFIAGRLHRHEGTRADSASVEIAFRFYHNGHEDAYVVNRSWIRDGASVSESLSLCKNGAPVNDVDESQWQSFIEGLIPLGIARLFFFDGEKIVRMTEWDDPNNDEIRSSLDMLLGAELIKRLHSDLDLYIIRRSGRANGADKNIQKAYEEMRGEKDALVSDIGALVAEREKKSTEIKDLTTSVGIKESKIASVGGGYADIRTSLLTQRAVAEEKIRQQGKMIQDDLADDAPFHLVPSLLGRIKERIGADMDIMGKKASATLVKNGLNRLKEEISSDKFWPAGVDHRELSAKISKRLDEMFEMPRDSAFFDLAPNDAAWMVEKIEGLPNGRDHLRKRLEEYGGIAARLEKIEGELAKTPRDDEIGPRISEINRMHQEIGILKSEVAHIDQQVSSKQAYQKILQNKLKGLIDSIHKDKTVDAGMRLASKMQAVLDSYSGSLKERKIRELESNLLDSIGSLLHKKHIHRVEIDRETLEIRVYENGDDDRPGNLKSMGERQIVGTALLWAIAKTSGRSLPFVIDTPLGRLDGKHMSNLMSRFYPFASHQLILLSTDREIGYREYAELSKYTSRSYRITCNESRSVTTVTRGYFMEEEIAST